MNRIKTIAQLNCANWNTGKCIGCVFSNKKNSLGYFIDSKLSGKDCRVEEGCDYFESIVVPGIADDKVRRSAQKMRGL
jgi:hypothetical protein|tara:strand:+ start:463 stop:696 length:234 start_codon:yes stop_codon:yes gene_type:complete